ncbi:MAG: hypothetical protein HKN47_02805 [Pirellulaceae bacterium]|nr:hypothetical protein [Pirellulaceae bacterium]
MLNREQWRTIGEVTLLMAVFFVYAGDLAPMVNEAHYLVKAKNFWDPTWCQNDLFAASGKAHTTFYVLLGWPTKFVSLAATAWIGRVIGWLALAVGLQRLSANLMSVPYACVGVAIVWIMGIQYGNLAGEWVVGGIEAKVPAYGFVLMALAELTQRRWERVWPLLGVASAFHVLSGGWSVIAAAIVWLFTERGREDAKPLLSKELFVGGAIALLGLVPALWLMMGVPRQDAVDAAKIYSYFRIKHHLLPADFQTIWFIRHGVLITATLVLWKWVRLVDDDQRWRRIGWFTIGSVAIASAGLLVGLLPPYLPDLAAKLLRYYWFRLTDAIVPLMFGLLVMRLTIGDRGTGVQSMRAIGVAVLLVASALIVHTSWEKTRLGVPPSASHRLLGWHTDATPAQQRAAFEDWKSACRWARGSTPIDEIFLTPRHQQTFKWYAHRAEVVNWKDVPQDAKSLKEWQRRFVDVFPKRLGTVRVTIKYSELRRYREQYSVRFMIVDRRITGQQLPLVKVYPVGVESNATFAIYELPR